MRRLGLVACVFLVSNVLATWLRGDGGDLGRIDFPTSGLPEAQMRFFRGALLLHSFEYEDAREEFRKAQALDPGFAMAYWGEAETFNHPIWMEQDRDAAQAALNRLAATREARLAKAPTKREKGYLETVEILYGDGDKASRDRAYAEAMRRLHEEFPNDLEAAAFYALALLGTCERERDIPTYMKAAAVAEEVFAKNPLHPGAVHYLIHSYDDPAHAPLGMRAARVYAKIAPAAAHALHMPSHIFFASGMWEEAASSNEAAWKASLDRARRRNLGPDEHNYHALFWLEYARLQQGRYAEARKTLATMEEDAGKSGSERARTHVAWMRAAYLVQTRRWDPEAARVPVQSEDSQRGLGLFLEGFEALEKGDVAGAEKALAEMKSPASDQAAGSSHKHGGAGMSYRMGRASSAGADAVLVKELEAKVLVAKGRADRAIELLTGATAAEDAMSFEFGPPVIVKPSHELLGEMLLALNRPADARKQFELALQRAPGRALSLLGLARAASKAGDRAAAQQTYGELQKNWSRADPDLPERHEIEQRRLASAGS